MPDREVSYPIDSVSAEHQRLVRQGAVFNPLTERLLREAGLRPGERVLDIGSGVGEVAMLAARVVGPSGTVTGVERDPTMLAVARSRASEAGLLNVRFIEGDVGNFTAGESFDAVVGRLILEYLQDPSRAVRSLARLVRSGGLLAFQDAWGGPLLQLTAHLPLRSRCAGLLGRTVERAGVHMDTHLLLYRVFTEADLPTPHVRIDVPVGDEPDVARWLADLFLTLAPRMRPEDLAESDIGELETLASRLEAARVAAKSFACTVGLVGAWTRKPR